MIPTVIERGLTDGETHGAFGPTSAEERFETARCLLFDNHRFTGSFAGRIGFCFAHPQKQKRRHLAMAPLRKP
jgi:hypothetical protein